MINAAEGAHFNVSEWRQDAFFAFCALVDDDFVLSHAMHTTPCAQCRIDKHAIVDTGPEDSKRQEMPLISSGTDLRYLRDSLC